MDNFDVRKYITEAKLSEQKKAYVTYTDGSTEDRTFHQSVSEDKIKKMLAPGTFIDGKQVLKVLVGDSLDQAMNEAEESYNQILQWAEENLDFELSDRIKDDIKDVLGDGVPVKVIKKMLSAPTGSRLNESDLGDAVEFYMDYYKDNEMPEEIRQAIIDALSDGKSLQWVKNQIKNGFLDMVLPESINEEKDVLEPEEDAEEDLYDYNEQEVDKIKAPMEKKLAKAIYSAYNPEDEDTPTTEIDQKYILSKVKEFISDKDEYYQMIHIEGPDQTLKTLADTISLDYLKKYVDKYNIKRNGQLGDAYDNLEYVLGDFTDFSDVSRVIAIYMEDK